ncbi:heterokaryon incompatibility protein-domain-containing protein [Apiospora rasikravindrae]|uniref:Heterokaryon incompatibility protein-domain-containing protein n=1 Tax=Apiospora rasikravindrae TaxID=990691 RepID=A0ABR1TXW0_9PEZI
MNHPSSSCRICSLFASVVDGTYIPPTDHREQLHYVIGAFSELRQSQAACDVCKLIVSKLDDDPRRDAYRPDCVIRFWHWNEPLDYIWSFGPLIDEEVNCVSCGQYHQEVSLTELPPFSDPKPELNPNWADLDRVKDWARHCDSTHQDVCHALSEWAAVDPPSLAPLLLVDVKAQCIVEVDLSVRQGIANYAALSYVWGRLPDVLESTRANLSQLKSPGALALPTFAHGLPGTVRDAIALTDRLGLDYLWVDRLCIVQDDAASKPLQLAQMGAIYANSYVTIIAADGADADHGLRGSVEGVSQPRRFEPPTVIHTPGGKTLISEPVFAHDYNVTEWERRGWTFQERALSRRNLVFQDDRVFWECHGGAWTEELPYDPPGNGSTRTAFQQRWKKQKPGSYQVTMSAWPDLVQYEVLVHEYNKRILSFPSDGLNAFLGISAALSRSLRGGLLFGLPEYYFDIVLLWAPSSTLRRRLVAGKPNPMLPSWSWAGWEGTPVNLGIVPHLNRRIDGLIFGSSTLEYIEIYPTVRWMKTRSDTQTQEEVDNGYYEAVQLKNDSSRSLPKGWSRNSVTQGQTGLGPGFKHESILDTAFTWPLNFPEHPIPFSLTKWEPLLRFSTTRSHLFIGSRLHRGWKGKYWNIATNTSAEPASLYHIRYASGEWAGVLLSNDFDTPPAGEHERCEFVVVSGGSTSKDDPGDHNGLEEWSQVPHIQVLSTYDFYNVLWIEWDDGVAYRKALGRVWKDSWDRQPTEVIDVVLG